MFRFLSRLTGKSSPKPLRRVRERPTRIPRRRERQQGWPSLYEPKDKPPRGPIKPMLMIYEAMERAGLTMYGLSALSGVDQTYLRRLLGGKRSNPSRDTLISFGEGLMHFDERFKKKDLERILKSAGMLKLPKNWIPRRPRHEYNPRTRVT